MPSEAKTRMALDLLRRHQGGVGREDLAIRNGLWIRDPEMTAVGWQSQLAVHGGTDCMRDRADHLLG